MTSFARIACVIALALACGCRPKTSSEDLLLEKKDPACQQASIASPLPPEAQAALHSAGQSFGFIGAQAPAARYVERLTHDGFLVRRSTSNLVMALAGLGIGALIAALALTLFTRRPAPRWAERLGQLIAKEIDQLRALGASGDALAKALIARFEEPLAATAQKARRLVDRAIPLARRDGSTTAQAHLESMHVQLEGLLGRIERIHLQLLMWNERQLREEDAALQAEVAGAIQALNKALEEAR